MLDFNLINYQTNLCSKVHSKKFIEIFPLKINEK